MNDVAKLILKKYGVKLGNFDNEKNRLFNMGLYILKTVEEYIKQVEKAGLTNEQFFLDFENDLNSQSIKDHNMPDS